MPVHIQELNNAETHFLNYILPRIISSRGAEHVSFVQVGANVSKVDGDPIYQLIASGTWKGLLIEPLPHVFEELKQNLAGIEGLSFANTAIGPKQGQLTLYYPEDRTVLASFDRDLVLSHLGNANAVLAEALVPCDTLENIICAAGIDHIDVLVTDTEGLDAQILLSTDFANITPEVIVWESKHLPDESKKQLAAHLERHGYIQIEMGANSFAAKLNGQTDDLFLMLKSIFTEFRSMERRSMNFVELTYKLGQTVLNNTPRG